jgi:hypothetical protein
MTSQANAVSDGRVLYQEAPYPTALEMLVGQLRYKAGWRFWLAGLDRGQGSKGLTLVINIETPDSYQPDKTICVDHYMLVPPAAYDMRSWRRWLFDQILMVERHEACEFFRLVMRGEFVRSDGTRTSELVERPYAPSHGPGSDPYLVREIGTDEDRRTSFRGEMNPSATE